MTDDMIRMTMAAMALITVGWLTQAPGAAAAAPENLRIAMVNMVCLNSNSADVAANRRNIQTNLDRHLAFIDLAVADGAEFVGFPEVSINGYSFGPHMTWLKLDGPEVKVLRDKARKEKIYISAGLAEEDGQGKRWNTQIVIDPRGQIVGRQTKMWLTSEKGHVESELVHDVFEVNGVKMGIIICADGTNFLNLKALVDHGAQVIYAPHANTTGGTTQGWYNFRARWGGQDFGVTAMYPTNNNGPHAEVPSGGWIDHLNVYAILHNHANLANPALSIAPPAVNGRGWASGAWVIGPDGNTLAQMPVSGDRAESVEYLLIHDLPVVTPSP